MIARLWRSSRGLRLGTRLALGLGALSLVVFAVVGTALTTYMRDYLSNQLDDQLGIAQVAQSKSIVDSGSLTGKKYWGWYYAVYDVRGGEPVLRKPEDPGDVPRDVDDLTALARAQTTAGAEVLSTAHLAGAGEYRLRACEVEPGVVLVSGAPMDDLEDTVGRLITVQAVAFGLALLALVVFGRALLRRGLKPLSDMAHTAHGIASHDLSESASRLPLRADAPGGGPEVEELRTAFNTMLEHIDDSLAVRAEAEQRLRRFVADASHELRTPDVGARLRRPLPVRGRQRARGAGQAPDPAARRGRPDGLPAGRPAAAGPAGRGRGGDTAADGEGRPGGTGRAGGRRVSREPSRPSADRGPGPVGRAAADGPPPHPSGPGQPADQRRRAHPEGHAGRRRGDGLAGHGAGPRERRGPGIPPEDRDSVFDRFYRVDKARSRDRGGSGLGLSVARSLVRAHGGSLELSPTATTTVFTVTLPLDPGPGAAVGAAGRVNPGGGTG